MSPEIAFLLGVALTALFFGLLAARAEHSARVVTAIVREARAGTVEDAVREEAERVPSPAGGRHGA